MKKFTHLFLLLFSVQFMAFAQTKDEAAVMDAVQNLFTGMKTANPTLVQKAFARQCIMQTIVSKNGADSVKTEPVEDFVKFIGSAKPNQFDERIVFTKILIDGPLASVWTDYKFYINSSVNAGGNDWKFSHCGVNSFQLFKGKSGWEIIYIIDTRRKENCGG